MFAVGGWAFLTSSYKIISGATTLSRGIRCLISKTELSKKDRLNLKALERRLICITQPLNHCLISQSYFNTLKQKPIEQSAILLEEIILFINRVNSTPNYVFDEDFSVELEHYCKELEFLSSTLQLSIDLNDNFVQNVYKDSQQISLSAMAKASHRLRSMCLVNGYLLQQKGALSVKIAIQSDRGHNEYQWINLYEGLSEMIVHYHAKQKRFLLEVMSTDTHSLDQNPQQDDIVSLMREKKKYQFVLNYAMGVNIVKSDLRQQLMELNKDDYEEDKINHAPKLQIDSESVQLLDVIQKQSRGDWIFWKSTSEDFQLIDMQKRYPDKRIEEFALRLDLVESNKFPQEYFSAIDIIYLLRLCAYENEQAIQFGQKQSKYVSSQQEFNQTQKKKDRDHGRGLIESEIDTGIIENEAELDRDSEINEVHGLAHLHASDEELYALLQCGQYSQ